MFLNILLLIGAFCGYYILYSLFFKRPAFFPLFFISGAVLVVYVFGLLEKLDLGVQCVLIGGLLSIPVSLFLIKSGRKRLDWKTIFLNPLILYLFLASLWAFLITNYETGLSHYDDFSHWYRICNVMHFEHAFPVTEDLLFPTYTPGTAVWIYFFTKCSQFSVSACFFSQSLLYIACLSVLFDVVPSHDHSFQIKALHFCLISIASVFLCAITISTYTLLVDTALGLVAMTAFLIVHRLDRPGLSAVILLFPELVFLSLIKTSGILFAVLIAAALFIKHRKTNRDRSNMTPQINDKAKKNAIYYILDALLVIVPVIFVYLYQIRAHRYYGDPSGYLQGLSLNRYAELFQDRTPAEITHTILNYLRQVFLGLSGQRQVKVLCFSLLGIGALYFFSAKERKNRRFLFVYSIVIVLVYSIGLILTYLFSMSSSEANRLASLYRYIGTLSVFIAGLFFMELLSFLQEKELGKQPRSYYASLCVVVLFFSLVTNTGYIWGYSFYEPEETYSINGWAAAEQYIPENDAYTSAKYVVLYDPQIFDYGTNYINKTKLNYIAEIRLRSNHIFMVSLDDVINLKVSANDITNMYFCDYFVSLGDFSKYEEAILAIVPIDEYVSGSVIPIIDF